MIKVNIKRGLLTGLVFLLIGFILGAMVLTTVGQLNLKLLIIPCSPGIGILGLFMTQGEIGHGGVMCLPLTNALAYGLIGCVIGAFFDIRRYALRCCVIFVILAVVSMSAIHAWDGFKRHQFITAMKVGCEHRLKTNPDEIHSLFWLGVHHFSRTRNYQEAKGYFEKILTLVPPKEHSEGYAQTTMLYLVIILKSEGQDEQSQQMYTRFLDTQPDFKTDCTLFNLNNDARTKLGLPRQNWETR